MTESLRCHALRVGLMLPLMQAKILLCAAKLAAAAGSRLPAQVVEEQAEAQDLKLTGQTCRSQTGQSSLKHLHLRISRFRPKHLHQGVEAEMSTAGALTTSKHYVHQEQEGELRPWSQISSCLAQECRTATRFDCFCPCPQAAANRHSWQPVRLVRALPARRATPNCLGGPVVPSPGDAERQ
mmetsp:Transcript_51083/g.81633  ORF Transcript_51083/g.81633 Transcript_51083/m.81633 type:complete len:182 (+) Transcript_51083:49-594(+)